MAQRISRLRLFSGRFGADGPSAVSTSSGSPIPAHPARWGLGPAHRCGLEIAPRRTGHPRLSQALGEPPLPGCGPRRMEMRKYCSASTGSRLTDSGRISSARWPGEIKRLQEKLETEGCGGFNPRIPRSESTPALAAEEYFRGCIGSLGDGRLPLSLRGLTARRIFRGAGTLFRGELIPLP